MCLYSFEYCGHNISLDPVNRGENCGRHLLAELSLFSPVFVRVIDQ